MCTEETPRGADARQRAALVYVRQCTIAQVFNRNESLLRQQPLRDRAVALGWPLARIHTIHSHFDPSDRQIKRHDGFQQLLSEITAEHAGVILAFEPASFTRRCVQWLQLIEACARTRTLISLDSGLYDPADFNGRCRLQGPPSVMDPRVIQTLVQRRSQVPHAE